MDNTLFGVENLDAYVVLGILVFFSLMEVMAGYLSRTKRKFSDWIQEAGGFLMLSLVIKPAIVLAAMAIGNLVFPSLQGAMSAYNLVFMLLFYILIDDVMQYWYHRSAHEYQFLWKLHRPHHQAEEMGFFISYRNAGLYYILMPNIWWVGAVVFLGGAKAVAIGLILKQLVIIGSHSTIKWDAPLYKSKLLKPIVLFLERIFITPAFHQSHHGKSMIDGISDPNGNYGNMFSIWDQLFGTAKFTHEYPTDLGLVNDPKEEWTASYFYPVITSKNPASEISRAYKKEDNTSFEPAELELVKGQKYLYCQCGLSKNQPFCDGAHQGTKIKPLLFEAKRTGKVKLCNCKKTNTGPFCDNSHLEFQDLPIKNDSYIEKQAV